MLATSRYVHMLQVHVAKIKVWPAQRGLNSKDIWPWMRMVCLGMSVQRVPLLIAHKLTVSLKK